MPQLPAALNRIQSRNRNQNLQVRLTAREASRRGIISCAHGLRWFTSVDHSVDQNTVHINPTLFARTTRSMRPGCTWRVRSELTPPTWSGGRDNFINNTHTRYAIGVLFLVFLLPRNILVPSLSSCPPNLPQTFAPRQRNMSPRKQLEL